MTRADRLGRAARAHFVGASNVQRCWTGHAALPSAVARKERLQVHLGHTRGLHDAATLDLGRVQPIEHALHATIEPQRSGTVVTSAWARRSPIPSRARAVRAWVRVREATANMPTERPTQPEMPAARVSTTHPDRSAVYRRVTVTRARDALADLVEEVVVHPKDPRAEH